MKEERFIVSRQKPQTIKFIVFSTDLEKLLASLVEVCPSTSGTSHVHCRGERVEGH